MREKGTQWIVAFTAPTLASAEEVLLAEVSGRRGGNRMELGCY
jgi:hypothetical protein